jgi:hypothetical protein
VDSNEESDDESHEESDDESCVDSNEESDDESHVDSNEESDDESHEESDDESCVDSNEESDDESHVDSNEESDDESCVDSNEETIKQKKCSQTLISRPKYKNILYDPKMLLKWPTPFNCFLVEYDEVDVNFTKKRKSTRMCEGLQYKKLKKY